MFKLDHHLLRMADGSDSSWLDSLFMKAVEDEIPRVIDALLDGSRSTGTLHQRDRRGLALFVNLLRATVPNRIEALESHIGRSPELSEGLAAWRDAHTGNPSPEEALRQFALGGAIFEVLTGGQTDEVIGRAWQLSRVPVESPVRLILGDDPVLEMVAPSTDAQSHVILAFALNPWTLLVMHPHTGADEPETSLATNDVNVINRIAWMQASDEAIAFARSDLDSVAAVGSVEVPEVLLAPSRRAFPHRFT